MSFRLLAVIAGLALAVPAIAAAATKSGITPLAPKAGKTVKTGSRPTFKMRVTGKGTVWVTVSKSAKRDKDGVIKSTSDTFFQRAKKKSGRVYQVKASYYQYPEFWLNSPGTYYWQAYRIDCTGDLDDCKREGPIVKFKVG
jgi:hypothetical protein